MIFQRLIGVAAIAGVATLFAAGPAQGADANPYDGNWHFSVTPYAWFPNVDAKVRFEIPPNSGGSPDVDTSTPNFLSDLRFAALLAGEARKDNWAFAMDVIYVDLGHLNSSVRDVHGPLGLVSIPVGTDVDTDLKATVWQGIASYTVARSAAGTLDVFGGVRYAGVKPAIEWNFSGPPGTLGRSGSLSGKVNLTDGIVGVRGAVKLGDDGRWFLPYYADVGLGNANWTWQAYAGLGYRFGWGDLLVAYRNLEYHARGDELLQDLRLGGPAIAATFRW